MLCLAEADLKLLLVSYVFPIILSLPEGIKFKFLGNLPNLLYVMSVISMIFLFVCMLVCPNIPIKLNCLWKISFGI